MPRELRIFLGAHDLGDNSETGRAIFDVRNVIIHKEWNPSTLDFTGDIALIKLAGEAQYSDNIIPICLPIDDILGIEFGEVVAWGYFSDSDVISNLPRKVDNLSIVSHLECVKHEISLAKIAWGESFCALKQENGVCKGDSGSGFYVFKNGRYYLRGIVSSSVDTRCSRSFIAVYSDVFKYLEFLTGGQVNM